ncbi:hypothetical protein [Prosthecobacter sp.]|uniref:hypothetical protein n=1 Tax=Prosthecobacter sp. TaxID=1965333 RepID=UPI002AB857E1|nr:hypothetical protein [Prosthecobacter sp.]MDZ4401654.1 hypothetical protein [Prosthecobacter sp.]
MTVEEIIKALRGLNERERRAVSYELWLLDHEDQREDIELAEACGLEMFKMLDQLEAEDEAVKATQTAP